MVKFERKPLALAGQGDFRFFATPGFSAATVSLVSRCRIFDMFRMASRSPLTVLRNWSILWAVGRKAVKVLITTVIGLAFMATSTLFAQDPIAVAETHPDCYLLNAAPVSGGVALSFVSVVALGIPGTDDIAYQNVHRGGVATYRRRPGGDSDDDRLGTGDMAAGGEPVRSPRA